MTFCPSQRESQWSVRGPNPEDERSQPAGSRGAGSPAQDATLPPAEKTKQKQTKASITGASGLRSSL